MSYSYITGNITLNSPMYTAASVTVPSHTHGAIPNGGYITGSTYSPAVNITHSGIELGDTGDIKLGEISLKETLHTIQERLAILVPDPKKLKKYEALQRAYEHYKLLETLCNEEDEK